MQERRRQTAVLHAAARNRRAAARFAAQAQGATDGRPAQPGPARGQVPDPVTVDTAAADGLPGRTGRGSRLRLADSAGHHAVRPVLAGPGTPPSRHRLAAPGTRGRRGLEGTAQPAARQARQPGRQAHQPAQPPAQGQSVLPGHRPLGGRGPQPLGGMGGALPHQGQRMLPVQGDQAAQGRHGPAHPGTPASPARPGTHRRNRTPGHPRPAPGGHGHRTRRDCRCPRGHPRAAPRASRPRLRHRPGHRHAPRSNLRGGTRLLGLGHRGSPASHRHPRRRDGGTDPPQLRRLYPAQHRRSGADAADRPVQDRHRAASACLARTRRGPRRDHSPSP